LKVNSFLVPQQGWFSVIVIPTLNLCNSKPQYLKIRKLSGAKWEDKVIKKKKFKAAVQHGAYTF
jgi:hypothetical protein